MLLGIDHVVIACHNPDAAAEQVARALGLTPGGGGRHPRFGTFNRLIWIGDSYLELMGVEDAVLARARGIGAATLALLARGEEGFASFAIASDALASDIEALRRAGAPYADPTPGERERPDGEVVRWVTALPDALGAGGLPFLIQHEYQGAEWGDAVRVARAALVQPFGGRAALERLEIAVADPAVTAGRYRRQLGLVGRQGGGSAPAGDIAIGSTGLRFVARRPGTPRATVVIRGDSGSPRRAELLGCGTAVEISPA